MSITGNYMPRSSPRADSSAPTVEQFIALLVTAGLKAPGEGISKALADRVCNTQLRSYDDQFKNDHKQAQLHLEKYWKSQPYPNNLTQAETWKKVKDVYEEIIRERELNGQGSVRLCFPRLHDEAQNEVWLRELLEAMQQVSDREYRQAEERKLSRQRDRVRNRDESVKIEPREEPIPGNNQSTTAVQVNSDSLDDGLESPTGDVIDRESAVDEANGANERHPESHRTGERRHPSQASENGVAGDLQDHEYERPLAEIRKRTTIVLDNEIPWVHITLDRETKKIKMTFEHDTT